LALETIAALENVQISDEDIEAEFVRISEAYSMDLAEVKARVATEDIKADMIVKAAMDLVKEKAVISA
jgi:trigger factor